MASTEVENETEAFVTGFQSHPESELEVVFKNITLPCGGVSFEVFNNLFIALSAAATSGLMFGNEKTAIIDFFYADSIRTRYVAGKTPVTIKKTRISSMSLLCLERPTLGITMHLKNEILQPMTTVPSASPLFVRLQEVWIFLYKDTFEYTLKKVVSGRDKQSACTKPPIYEIEIEILRGTWLNSKNDEQIAKSLLCKIGDMCGRYDQEGNQVDLTIVSANAGEVSDPDELRHSQRKLIAARKRKEQRKRKAEMLNDQPTSNKKKYKKKINIVVATES
jgi:hypothetical protein